MTAALHQTDAIPESSTSQRTNLFPREEVCKRIMHSQEGGAKEATAVASAEAV